MLVGFAGAFGIFQIHGRFLWAADAQGWWQLASNFLCVFQLVQVQGPTKVGIKQGPGDVWQGRQMLNQRWTIRTLWLCG